MPKEQQVFGGCRHGKSAPELRPHDADRAQRPPPHDARSVAVDIATTN